MERFAQALRRATCSPPIIQSRQGLPMFHPRPPMEQVTDQQKAEIDKHLAPLLAL